MKRSAKMGKQLISILLVSAMIVGIAVSMVGCGSSESTSSSSGIITDIKDIPDKFIKQCEDEGKETIIDFFQENNAEFQQIYDCAGYDFILNGENNSNMDSDVHQELDKCFGTNKDNGLCFMYFVETTNGNGEWLLAPVCVTFYDLYKQSDGEIDYDIGVPLDVPGTTDPSEDEKTILENANDELIPILVNWAGFTVSYSTMMDVSDIDYAFYGVDKS